MKKSLTIRRIIIKKRKKKKPRVIGLKQQSRFKLDSEGSWLGRWLSSERISLYS